ncbi:MAG TPA: nuclear transport factor 2 family protein [Phycisphaerae bacterium]|nr:nuclear transport factor 2 family protein [Phycisphaerae bacterium]
MIQTDNVLFEECDRVNATTPDESKLELVLDRIAIEDCLHRYCHAVDRCDPDLLRGVYWPEATDDHIFWRGKAEAFVEFCMPILKSRDQTMHSISNILIRIEGHEARVQSYYLAYERLRQKNGTPNDVVMAGRYLDRMEKRGAEWRIADRKVVMDWWRIYHDSCDWERGVFGQRFEVGKRGLEDPSAALFGNRLHGR